MGPYRTPASAKNTPEPARFACRCGWVCRFLRFVERPFGPYQLAHFALHNGLAAESARKGGGT